MLMASRPVALKNIEVYDDAYQQDFSALDANV